MSKSMTPDQAGLHLSARDAGWVDNMPFYAVEALETIVKMRREWGVEIIRNGRSEGVDWCHDRGEAEDLIADKDHFPPADEFRLVRRYVSVYHVVNTP